MNSKETFGVLKALSLLVQLGLSMAVPLIGLVWLGQLVGRAVGAELIALITSVVLGLGAGGLSVYRILSKEIK